MNEHMLAGYAIALLKKDNKVLFLQRSNQASFAPGHYSLIGGRVEKNENFRQALVREIQEEVGITIDPTNLHFKHTFYRKGESNEIVVCVFECDTWQGEVVNKEPEKHPKIIWANINALPDPLIPAHKNILSLLKQGQAYSEQP